MKRLVVCVVVGFLFGLLMSLTPTACVGGVRCGWPIPTARFPWGWTAVRSEEVTWEFGDEGYLSARDRELGLVALFDFHWVAANSAIGGGIGLLVWASCSVVVWTIRRRDPRRRAGHCRSCGYDLTGNESGVCPECGTSIALQIQHHSRE